MNHWLLAIRPRTLGLALSPVIMGCALAWFDTGRLDWPLALSTLLAALLIQIGTNLHNDAADFERGGDGPDRIGPPRATAQGWFSARQVRRAAAASFGLAFLCGIYLAWSGGWPIVVIGLLSLLAGYGYTGGPRPIAYTPFGELLVFLFFGLAAVGGSYYLQTRQVTPDTLLAAASLGLFAAAVLLVNNHRDREADRQAGRRTLALLAGERASHAIYALLMLLPYLLPLVADQFPSACWLILFTLPRALRLIWRFASLPPGPELNPILAQTARQQLGFSLLFCLGLLASPLLN